MRRVTKRLVLSATLLLAAPGAVPAQREPLATVLPQFFADGISLSVPGHEAHFNDQGEALEAMGDLNTAISSQFATYPLGSSSGAFTFVLDPEIGAYVPSSESFGPIFAERPETLGKGRVNFGVTFLYYDFESLEGFDFDTGEIAFNLVHEDTNGDGTSIADFFEGDLIDSRLFVDLDLATTIFFASFGVTDRFDLGIAVPYVEADLKATVRSTILPLATGSGVHSFAGGGLTEDDTRGGSANGLGDVTLRGKYDFKRGLGLAFDIRFPTGDEEELLGSGATRVKLLFIARAAKFGILHGGFFPHLNLGFTYSTGSYEIRFDDPSIQPLKVEASDEVNFALGFDAALGRRVTLAFDIVGRMALDAGRLSRGEKDFLYTSLGGAIATETRPSLTTTQGDLATILGTLGLKFHLGKQIVLTLSGLTPITTDNGLEAEFVGNIGLDFTF